jgi:hypothetical protein
MSDKKKLTFQYKLPPSLRGKTPRPKGTFEVYPLIPIQLYYQGKNLRFEALLDSGADKLFLPRAIANALELPLGAKRTDSGVTGKFESYGTKVGLIIGSGSREYDFGIIEACTPVEEQDVPILIGRHPVFDEYQIRFEQYNNKFKLIPK